MGWIVQLRIHRVRKLYEVNIVFQVDVNLLL